MFNQAALIKKIEFVNASNWNVNVHSVSENPNKNIENCLKMAKLLALKNFLLISLWILDICLHFFYTGWDYLEDFTCLLDALFIMDFLIIEMGIEFRNLKVISTMSWIKKGNTVNQIKLVKHAAYQS